jgi:hypothetical protein
VVPDLVDVIKGDSNRHIERMRVRVQMKANVLWYSCDEKRMFIQNDALRGFL